MKGWTKGVLALVVALAFAGSAFAQGGGASSTGTIQGRVTDAQGAVLPGVTVTATSPSALGAAVLGRQRAGDALAEYAQRFAADAHWSPQFLRLAEERLAEQRKR